MRALLVAVGCLFASPAAFAASSSGVDPSSRSKAPTNDRQRASPRAQARRPVLAWKMDANGVEGSFAYVRPDDSPFAKCARSFLSGGLFDVSLSFGNGFTDVESPMACGVRRTCITYDRLLRETSRTTGAETLSKTYDAAGEWGNEKNRKYPLDGGRMVMVNYVPLSRGRHLAR